MLIGIRGLRRGHAPPWHMGTDWTH
jgi:hypothetical protein